MGRLPSLIGLHLICVLTERRAPSTQNSYSLHSTQGFRDTRPATFRSPIEWLKAIAHPTKGDAKASLPAEQRAAPRASPPHGVVPARRDCPLQSSVQEGSHRSMAPNPSSWLVRAPDQMAWAGTVAARAPQVPERIEESRERSAESMLSRQRYFTCTHWMA